MPTGKLSEDLVKIYGSFEEFKKQFSDVGKTRFGSGWAWLGLKNGKLTVLSTPNQDVPMMDGLTPILTNDVWEHAYYLKYQNRRAEYVNNWWNVVNWDEVTRRYEATKG